MSNQDLKDLTERFAQDYAATLRPDYHAMFQRFRWVDTAMKVVGVGSVLTRCLVALRISPIAARSGECFLRDPSAAKIRIGMLKIGV